MKRFLAALALTCVLSVSAFSGDMPISGSPAPSPPSGTTMDTTEPGDIQTPGKAALSSEALSALLSVLSFLAA